MATTMFHTLKLNQVANIWRQPFISYDLDEPYGLLGIY